MQKQVSEALKQHVFDSEATVVFIRLCKLIISTFLDTNLKPLERVYNIWHSVFVLRIWRNWIRTSTIYNLKDNFISENAHTCIELNALGLLHLIIKLRDAKKPEWFLTHMFDSQPCESTFRQMRSMGTINFTKINFTFLELLHLVERVELQNEIMYNRLANVDIKFPRNNITKEYKHVDNLPSNEELIGTLKSAQQDAKKLAFEFGMHFDDIADDFDMNQCPIRKPNLGVQKKTYTNDSDNEASNEEPDEDYNFSLNNTDSLNLREYNRENVSLAEISKFIEVSHSDGSTQIVRKSSIVWILSDSPTKLSSDRLKRVQSRVQENEPKRSKLKHQTTHSDQRVYKSNEIAIGEWCIFSTDLDIVQNENYIKNIIAGIVLSFKYSDGKTDKQRQYHKDTASISKDDKNNRDIVVLSNWHAVSAEGILSPLKGLNGFFVPIQKYLVTVENLNLNTELQLKIENLNLLKEFNKD